MSKNYRFIPEELIRALQAAYWSVRLVRILFQERA